MPKSAYINAKPETASPGRMPRDAIKREIAKRLQAAILEKGWNQSELARQAALHMPDNAFGRDNVSAYVRGLSIPGPLHLEAMAKALGVKPSDIVPSKAMPSVDNDNPTMDVRDAGEGHAWLRINKSVPWPVAVKIMDLMSKDEDDG